MGVNDRQNRTVLFVHIPKTAGTTLRVLFTQQYAQQPWFVIHHDIPAERALLEKTPASVRATYRMIFGHMAWGWHRYVPEGRAYAYTTMLREPVERVLSLFSHCRVSQHYLGAALQGHDIEWFLTSGVTGRADNAMVRQLCGRDWFTEQKPWSDTHIPLGHLTDVDLKAAKDNLRSCALVGVTERFDDYLDAGKTEFGWRFGGYQRVNVTRWERLRQQDLTPRQRQAIEQATWMDRELYELAAKLARGQG